VSDLLGKSGRRMLEALLAGVTDPVGLAALGDRRLQASQEQLADALSGRLTEAQRLVLRLFLGQIDQIEQHLAELDQALAKALAAHQDAIARLCEIPGINVRTAQYILAETGPLAAVFDSAGKLASWVGICPGQQESAGMSVSARSAKGNWMLRRTLSQIAWAAVASKGSEAQRRFHAWRPRLGTQKAIWAVAHYQLRVIWKVLHDGVRYRSPGYREAESACPPGPCQARAQRTTQAGLYGLHHTTMLNAGTRCVRVFSSVLQRFERRKNDPAQLIDRVPTGEERF
jgi:transposase